MTIIELAAAVKGIIRSVVSVAALFKKADATQHNSVTSKKAENISVGNQNASTGGIAVGAGGTVNINLQAGSGPTELVLRNKVLQELFVDYKNTHDNIPITIEALHQSAQPYINERLSLRGVSWRYDAVNGIVDGIEN